MERLGQLKNQTTQGNIQDWLQLEEDPGLQLVTE
jgi:hypothetical protein